MVEDDQVMGEFGPGEYDEVVITKNAETIDAFSMCVIPMKTEKAYLRERINDMTQALRVKDGSLPQGLTVQNRYTELRTGSINAIVVVRNSTAYPKLSGRKLLWYELWPQLLCQNCQLRLGCWRGQTNLKTLTPLN